MKNILEGTGFLSITAQKIKFPIKNFFSKCDQLRIGPHLLKKSLMERFIFCVVHGVKENEKENTEEVIEILENEMQDKESINDTDRFHRLGKNIPGVDLGL